jgi:endonuclease-3
MAESEAARRARAARILTLLDRAYPDAGIELAFSTPLELLVATILSAQCTDERVNMVTAGLFPRYRSARDWARIPAETLEREIFSTGFYRAKARSILGMAAALVERHGGEVPRTPDELTALPGVGRKTANVVLGNAFSIPAIAVDTHVTRVSQRLGLTRATEVEGIHDALCKVVPRPKWTSATHLLIIHGRRTCFARTPNCPACAVRALCPWPGKTIAGVKPARPTTAAARVPRRRPSAAGKGSRGRPSRRAPDARG